MFQEYHLLQAVPCQEEKLYRYLSCLWVVEVRSPCVYLTGLNMPSMLPVHF